MNYIWIGCVMWIWMDMDMDMDVDILDMDRMELCVVYVIDMIEL